jgi:outer membrane protein assembly factor BamD
MGVKSFVSGMLALSMVAVLSGCASLTEDRTAKWTAAEFYEEAKAQLDEGNYQQAIDMYNKLEARYPYGPYTEQAQLELAYAHFKNDEGTAAVGAADRFIKQHPTHPNVDYAYYLRGLASYRLPSNFLEGIFPQDMSKRDPSAARDAFRFFKELTARFPNSKYTPDAIQRMTYLRNSLAQYEIHAADYYMRRGAWLAAADRAKYVVESYQRTPAVADALAMMVTAYREMGLTDLATDAEKLLQLNYPGRSAWVPGENQ